MAFLAEKLEDTAFLLVDVQEKLYPEIENHTNILSKILSLIESSRLFSLPIVVTEQYPKGLSKTIKPIVEKLPKDQVFLEKTTFSALRTKQIKEHLDSLNRYTWIIAGIESHVCVLQTAKDMLESGKKVIILEDAIGSRNNVDYNSALQELRKIGARVSSTETILFELLLDTTNPKFKMLSQIVKTYDSKK